MSITCHQTASWLSDTPPVVEECARAATQPQLLKILLQHQACLGHLETAGRVRLEGYIVTLFVWSWEDTD